MLMAKQQRWQRPITCCANEATAIKMNENANGPRSPGTADHLAPSYNDETTFSAPKPNPTVKTITCSTLITTLLNVIIICLLISIG